MVRFGVSWAESLRRYGYDTCYFVNDGVVVRGACGVDDAAPEYAY
jgi:hypothetical protein